MAAPRALQLGDPLAEQALGPFLNNLEQNMPHPKQVIGIVKKSSYAGLFEAVWGAGSLDDKKEGIAATYVRIGRPLCGQPMSVQRK
jgi:cytochrome c peroxidase